jgi:ferredoxin-thioredoxin reductase catalytic chain
MEAYEENIARIEKIAAERGLALNSDMKRVEKVARLMTDSFIAIGEYVCPCKQEHRPPVKGKEVLCPCPDMDAEIETDGHCHCRLFFRAG